MLSHELLSETCRVRPTLQGSRLLTGAMLFAAAL
jgi:hypothetical protein